MIAINEAAQSLFQEYRDKDALCVGIGGLNEKEELYLYLKTDKYLEEFPDEFQGYKVEKEVVGEVSIDTTKSFKGV